ncbi:MAG: YqaA family protein [Candidatus Pacebacteria bacterium]|jgi:membrane protein YqaA with SNARE-associated domain|nr:cytochrome B [bacterium]MDP6528005.1 YqaA family protein [Candidatus Paceibacterota bacterium]MDP6659737.1 YqaA family protein [Candidatus Paceibacterota bacterium]|tara:strand:- start:359 stop:979 length:621 start_codon:yes stop_codon:yes gene_type:complete
MIEELDDKLEELEKKERRGIRWFKKRAYGTGAKWWLGFLSFTESSFLFIPPDLLLVAILLVNSERWIYYAVLTTVTAVLGGAFGYFVGAFFYDIAGVPIIEFYNLAEEFERIGGLFNGNSALIIFTAAFTPIPYKVFVLAGGFFKMNFLIFIIFSALGRGLRYFIVAYITHLYGERAVSILKRHARIATIAAVVIILGALFGALLL